MRRFALPAIGALATAALTAALLTPAIPATAQTQLVVATTDSARFTASDNWGTSSWSSQKYGDSYRFASPDTTASDPAWFRFNIPSTGSYNVDVWYPADSGYNNATPFMVSTTTGTQSVTVNQRTNGGQWFRLGTFQLAAGDANVVGVSRWTTGTGHIIADAVRITDAASTPTSNVRVQRSNTDPNLMAALRAELGTVSVSTVLNSANRTGRTCSPTVKFHSESFCWDPGDSSVTYWMPQGITTTGDAVANGRWDGREALLAAWYDKDSGGNMGVRVSLVDIANP
jgi:hypothetical protein